jgi:hypothetical protein
MNKKLSAIGMVLPGSGTVCKGMEKGVQVDLPFH